ncbi:MAG: xanthine dehydrogenase molybdopterin binding subunit [Myxococcota bacterium]
MTAPPRSVLHQPAPHESGLLHATGGARYVDDLPEPAGLLHGVLVLSSVARGRLRGIDAAGCGPGITVLTAADIPGDPWVGPVVHDEPVLAVAELLYAGMPVALVLAETREAARAAAARVVVDVEPLPAGEAPVLTIDDAIAADRWFGEPHVIARGDLAAGFAASAVVIDGVVDTPAQDHFYLETHCALAAVDERAITVWSSTQHPTEIQRMVARVLGWSDAQVTCVVPRLGGGFGGKESQATAFACLAAVGAVATGRPCKVWLTRHEDMVVTGKRHPFRTRYRAGFDRDGRILAFEADVISDGGCTFDLSLPIVDRCLFHLDNAYRLPAVWLRGRVARTDKASNTAFRGFGGPQGMVVVEDAIERAAGRLGLDPIEVRRRNYYRDPADTTPYGQRVEDPRIGPMTDRLVADADYARRRAELDAHNARATHTRRGLGFVPVKFGISFTNALLNQAGALVLVYADGSVQLNHGGTEMGQGLHTKMVAVCADVLGVRPEAVRPMPTSTDKVPNTSATAASSGSDLNGQAVREACAVLKARMAPVAAALLGLDPGRDGEVGFADGAVHGPDGASIPFARVAKQCWLDRVSLSATGFYRTPGIAYDRAAGRGTPFYYFAYGVALAEVELSGLTGEHRIRRIDVVHDVGDSLVPSIDVGQVEGALVQGIGWLTNEDVVYGSDGRVRTVGPSTYKIPSVGDVPLALNVALLDGQPQAGTIGGSKAVGEPPFMLGIAVWNALRDAVRAFGVAEPALARPATPEALLRAVLEPPQA